MNKTEKLGERMGMWLPDMPNKARVITAILCECKEAGLMFRCNCKECPKRKEDDFGLLCILTCTELFEEMDI